MNNRNDNFRSRPYYPTQNNDNRYKHQYRQSTSTNYSYLAAPPTPLMTAIPQERESWIRSVKKTKLNESTEQKTQYLETMLRMPQQQKSSINSSTFDRIRFANNQIPMISNTIENSNNNNLEQSSFHLINNLNNHHEICAIEQLLFDHSAQSTSQIRSNQIIDCPPIVRKNSEAVNFSGFLIDNCDEEEIIPISPPPPALCLPIEESIQPNQEDLNEQCAVLVSELNAADAEQKQLTKRQKRFQKRLQRKKNQKKAKKSNTIVTVNNKNQESSSDWIVEYDIAGTDQLSQLTDTIRRTSTTITDENKIAKVNLILKRIKKQQKELKRLRRCVISMLDEGQKQNSNDNQDLLMKFLNQPFLSGCWLCSEKTYTETSTQSDNIDQP